jgi:TonB family protein
MMIDSTARAPRFENEGAAPAYLWAPAGKPVSVSIPLTVIDRLERIAVESFRSLSSRGSEIGGILFGAAEAGTPTVVAVESYDAVECEYTSGPLYRLSDAELARLDRLVEQRAAAGIYPVGFYRSHTRKGLSLDAADLALFDSRFREAHQIALVIRPAAAKASIAGIFFREDGVVHGDASCLEFPFRSSQHEGPKTPAGLYEGAVAGPRSVAASPAPPRPVIRAQIVPIASRREIAPETPLPAPIAAVPEPAPAPPPAPVPAAQEIAPEPPKAVEPPPAPVAAKPVEPKRMAAAAVAVEEPEPVKSGSSKLLWIALGALASVVLCVGFILSSGMLNRGPKTPAGAVQDNSPLALRVDRNGADIVLTWNRDSEAIRKASRAVLEISDGAQHENVAMDLPQLRNGSIVYTPVTGDVVFRMEVAGADQSKTLSESVRVLRTRPSPLDPPSTEQPAAQTAAAPKPGAPPAAAETASASGPSAAEEEKVEKPVALAQAMKPFRADSLAQRLRPANNVETPAAEAPALSTRLPAATPSVNLGSIVSTQAPLPAPSAPAPSAPAVPAAGAEKRGGQIVQAQLIRKRDPEYPKIARDSGASGVVELVATIGADGKVKSVRIVKGHPLLRQAASDAVKGWVYRPTMLNGTAIESETTILLNFKGDR